MDLIERLKFAERKMNTKFVNAINKIYAPLERIDEEHFYLELNDNKVLLYNELINFKYERKVHAVYVVSRIFTAAGKNVLIAEPMAELYKDIWDLEVGHSQKYNLKKILKDQIDKEINFIDKMIGYHRKLEGIDSVLKRNRYYKKSLSTYLVNISVVISKLFHLKCDVISPKMICNIFDKLYYIMDMPAALTAFLNIIKANWEELEWTHRFYLHRYFRLIERLIKGNKAINHLKPLARTVLTNRNNQWLVKNQFPSNFENKTIMFQEDWTMQFKQTVRHFFNARKTDCLVCDELIKTDDKKQLLKHYSQKSHMQKLQNQLIALYDSRSEICAICPKSKTAEDHKGCNHDELVKYNVCLSCFICHYEVDNLQTHFKTRVHIYETLGLYDDQKSEAIKKQLIIREARKFAVHPKYKPKRVSNKSITDSLLENKVQIGGTKKELDDFFQEMSSKVEAEMDKLIKNLQNRKRFEKAKNYRLLGEYREETIKVEDFIHSIISEVRPFYKLEKYKSEDEEKQFIESILKSELIPDGPEDGGPFSASEDEDDKSPKPPPSTSDQSVAAPEVVTETPKQKSPTDPAKDKAVSSIPLAPPPGLPHPPSASVQLEKSKLATSTKKYSKKAKSAAGSAPVSPGSDGSPSEKGSPKPPRILVEPPVGLQPPSDLSPPPASQSPTASAQLKESKLAVPTKKYSKKAKSAPRSAPVSPGTDGPPSKKVSPKSPSISVEPPQYHILRKGLPPLPAPQSPTASAQLKESKLAVPTKQYYKKGKSASRSAPVSPGSDGPPSRRGSPKSPSISVEPPRYQPHPPRVPPPPAIESFIAFPPLEKPKLAIPTQQYSKKDKSAASSAPVSPGSDGSPSEKYSPKPPRISVEPPADADDQPPPSKGAIPKKKPAELIPPKKSKTSKDSSPTSPAGSGGSSPGDGGGGGGGGGGGDDPGAPDSDDSGDEDLLPNGHIKLRVMKEKSFAAIKDLISRQKGNDPENIALANELEFFLRRLYFSDFLPLDVMAACINHSIDKIDSEERREQK